MSGFFVSPTRHLAYAAVSSACNGSLRLTAFARRLRAARMRFRAQSKWTKCTSVPRSGGRVEKIFAQEGDKLARRTTDRGTGRSRTASATRSGRCSNRYRHSRCRLRKRRSSNFLRDDAKRQQDLLKRKVVSPSDAERAVSAANAQEKVVEAARMRVIQARAQLADIDAQLAEMKVKAPTDSILEVLSVKVGDVLPANREVATLLLPQHLWVRVFVPEPWLGLIKVGDPVRVRVDSFPGKDFDGTVEQINRQAEFTPRNVQTVEDRIRQVFGVKIRLPNNDDELARRNVGRCLFSEREMSPASIHE